MRHAILLAVMLLPVASAHGDVEHLDIVAKDNFFEIDGQAQSPAAALEPGKEYEVTLVNEGQAPHDIHFDFDGDGASDASVTAPGGGLLDPGQSNTATFTVPNDAFGGVYWCSAHGTSGGGGMAGTIDIASEDENSPGFGLLGLLAAAGVALVLRRR